MTVSIEQKQQIVASINWPVEYPNKPETYWHHIMSSPSTDHTFAKLEQIKQTIFNLYKQYNFDVQAGQNAWTPLHVAVLKDHRDGISFLLEQNISLEIQDKYGRAATDYADEPLHKFMQAKAKAHAAQQTLELSLQETDGISAPMIPITADNFPYDISISVLEKEQLKEFIIKNYDYYYSNDYSVKIIREGFRLIYHKGALKSDEVAQKLLLLKKKFKQLSTRKNQKILQKKGLNLLSPEEKIKELQKKMDAVLDSEIEAIYQAELNEMKNRLTLLYSLHDKSEWNEENLNQFKSLCYETLIKAVFIYNKWNDQSSQIFNVKDEPYAITSLSGLPHHGNVCSKNTETYRKEMMPAFNTIQKITNKFFLELMKRKEIPGLEAFGILHIGNVKNELASALEKESGENKIVKEELRKFFQTNQEKLSCELDFNEYLKPKLRAFCYYKEASGYIAIPISEFKQYPVMYDFNYGHSFYNIHPTIKRSVVFEGAQLIEQSGLFIELEKLGDLKIRIYNGLSAKQKAFSSMQNLESSISDYWREFIKQQLQALPRAKDHNRTMFLPIPVSQQEKNEVLLCLLEELHQEISSATDKRTRAEIQDTIDFIEEEFEVSLEEAALELQAICLSEYEQRIQNAQQQVTQKVIEQAQAEENTSPAVRSKKNKTQKKLASKSKAAAAEHTATGESSHETIAKIKQNGRIKWRNTIKLLNTILKSEAGLRQKQRGSHITISSDKGATTLVKPHKKDRTSSYKGLLSFVDKLSSLLNP